MNKTLAKEAFIRVYDTLDKTTHTKKEWENKCDDMYLIRQALEEHERMQWQPIETALKDGNPILLGCFDNSNSWCGSDMWSNDRWLNHERCSKSLTHWMPLPTPPKEDV